MIRNNMMQSLEPKIYRGGYISPLVKFVRITGRQCFLASNTIENVDAPGNWNTIEEGWDD